MSPIQNRDEFRQWREERYPELEPAPKPQDNPMGGPSVIGDVLMGIPRGLEGAVQDVWGLADTVAFDLLPDYDERLFGESQTAAGSLSEGVVNFLAGFIPVAGAVGKLGKVGRALKLTKQVGDASRLTILGEAAAGAITDLAVFGGREQRLSNLIQEFPILENPVTEFLAASEDDSEITGRLKNVLEGLALGALAEPFTMGLRALKKQRKLLGEGKAPDLAKESQALSKTEPFTVAGPKPKPTEAPESFEGVLTGQLGVTPEKAKAITADLKAKLEAGYDPYTNPRDLTPQDLIAKGLERSDLNLSRFAGSDEGATIERVLESMFRAARKEAAPGLQRVPEPIHVERIARQTAEMLGTDPDAYWAKWSSQLDADLKNIVELLDRVHSHRAVAFSLASEVGQKSIQLATDGVRSTELDWAVLAQAHDFLGAKMAQMESLGSEMGRSFRMLQRNVVPLEQLEGSLDLVQLAIDGHGGKDALARKAAELAALYGDGGLDGVRAVVTAAKYSRARKALNLATEFWINAILSGPKTLGVNIMSAAMLSVYRPLELAVGGGVQALLGNSAQSKQAFQELFHLLDSVKESAQLAYRASKQGEGILTSRTTVDVPLQDRRAWRAETFGASSDTVSGKVINFMGATIRYPTALMLRSDEFFKQINYRAVVKADLLRQGMDSGYTGARLEEFVRESMDKLIYKGQALSHEMLVRRGMDAAAARGMPKDQAIRFAKRYANSFQNSLAGRRLTALGKRATEAADASTLTTPLPHDSLSGDLNRFVTRHPMMRFAIPFVRTPVNIVKFAGQRLDIAGFAYGLHARRFPAKARALQASKNRMVRDLVSGDPRKAAEAYGRMMSGVGFTGIGLTMAYNGTLTGRGPSDPEQRKALEAAGWQPYSFFDGERYISYQRLDPYATLLGIWADLSEYLAHSNDPNEDESLLYALGVSIANNFTNKTYLTGIRNLVDALTEPDRHIQRWMQRQVASFVPNVLGQAVGVGDENMREVRSMLDAVRSKVPGLAEGLPVQRNILGEPVRRVNYVMDEATNWAQWWSPLAYRQVSNDKIALELANLGHGWTPPKQIQGGLDLLEFRNSKDQTAYDRWTELQGQVKIGKRNLRAALSALIDSKAYQNMDPTPDYGGRSPRVAEIQRVLNRYRRAAMRQLRKEYPDLVRAEEILRRQRLAAKYPSVRQILEQ